LEKGDYLLYDFDLLICGPIALPQKLRVLPSLLLHSCPLKLVLERNQQISFGHHRLGRRKKEVIKFSNLGRGGKLCGDEAVNVFELCCTFGIVEECWKCQSSVQIGHRKTAAVNGAVANFGDGLQEIFVDEVFVLEEVCHLQNLASVSLISVTVHLWGKQDTA